MFSVVKMMSVNKSVKLWFGSTTSDYVILFSENVLKDFVA